MAPNTWIGSFSVIGRQEASYLTSARWGWEQRGESVLQWVIAEDAGTTWISSSASCGLEILTYWSLAFLAENDHMAVGNRPRPNEIVGLSQVSSWHASSLLGYSGKVPKPWFCSLWDGNTDGHPLWRCAVLTSASGDLYLLRWLIWLDWESKVGAEKRTTGEW
jgi:hypothetical protein